MYKKKPTQISSKAALSKVQFICSKQEKCCSDIRKKLQDWNISADDQDEIISSLIEDKFIDESRFTNFFVRDKYRFNKWGRIKISYHLKHKQIPERIINEALEQINDQEYKENLQDLLQSKLRSLKDDDPYQLKTKMYRFAQSRGFESQLSLNLIDDLLSELK
ncbi:RecX family transcriptional regulator [Marinifilum breve]|uniref:Regulatory protein RecX n=1 Tax=Marinifilum breve TaxID=2184082 RepID=A0A2V3ZWQ7_9BACT|nr:regulatory protein RecX [Marinifilum breve]PXY00912.1 RecX family transcriptional regulator [Marinifilum breve]